MPKPNEPPGQAKPKPGDDDYVKPGKGQPGKDPDDDGPEPNQDLPEPQPHPDQELPESQ